VEVSIIGSSKPDMSPGDKWTIPMRTIILAAAIAMTLGMESVNAETQPYHAPAHNYYQNNWMAGG
jgi:hypothetical protein